MSDPIDHYVAALTAGSIAAFASASLVVGRRKNPKVTGENSPVTLGAVRY